MESLVCSNIGSIRPLERKKQGETGGFGRVGSTAVSICLLGLVKKCFEWFGLSGLEFYLGCLMMSSNHEAILSKEVFQWYSQLPPIEIPFQRFRALIGLPGLLSHFFREYREKTILFSPWVPSFNKRCVASSLSRGGTAGFCLP